MKIAYFPGCSLHSTGAEFDISTRKVCAALDIELCEVNDWVCCGSSPAHQCDELMSNGVSDLHFYTLNKSELVFQVCRALGVEPEPVQIAAGCG